MFKTQFCMQEMEILQAVVVFVSLGKRAPILKSLRQQTVVTCMFCLLIKTQLIVVLSVVADAVKTPLAHFAVLSSPVAFLLLKKLT